MITSFCRGMLAWFACAVFALGQGSQLPRYTVATLPAASTQPHYIVQVIDGASSTDCATGGGAQNVVCVNVAGAWHALGSVSPTFTGTATVNSAPAYSVNIGPQGSMTASWNFDTTTAATACASLGCATGGGTITGITAGSGISGGGTSGTVTVTNSAPMVYPGTGVPNSTGSAWGTSYSTTGTGTSIALSVSPALTGTPTSPTASASDNSTQIATDAFVHTLTSQLSNEWQWYTPSGSSMPTLNVYVGSIFYLRTTTTGTVYGQINLQGTISCGTSPAYEIVDLGTSVATPFTSATVITSSSFGAPGNAAFLAGAGLPLTGGHYFGFGYTAGACTAFPRVDIQLTSW